MRQKKSWLSRQYPGSKFLLALLVLGVISTTIFLFIKANRSGLKLIQLNFIAILAGLIVEYRRLCQKWSTVLGTAAAAYMLSFFAFAPGRREKQYIFEEHLELWPYFFLGIFIIIAMVAQFTAITKKLTEGITLLLTFAINYWIFANNYFDSGSLFVKFLIFVNICVSVFSVYHAFSNSTLTRGSRVILSIWSSVIILVLAADNFLKLYRYRDIENLPALSDSILAFLEFFLLGISSIYIAQNLTMVGAYLPGKRYMESVREMNEVHLERFSEEQVYAVDSIIISIISLTGFVLNYYFQWVPVNFMIWAMITLAPVLLFGVHRIFS